MLDTVYLCSPGCPSDISDIFNLDNKKYLQDLYFLDTLSLQLPVEVTGYLYKTLTNTLWYHI